MNNSMIWAVLLVFAAAIAACLIGAWKDPLFLIPASLLLVPYAAVVWYAVRKWRVH